MSYINDFIKPTDYGSNRKDINRILALIHDIVAQEPEDDGLQERIMLTPHIKLRTQTSSLGSDLVNSFSETRGKESSVFRRVIGSNTSSPAYPYTNSTTGTITYSGLGGKFGGNATFDSSAYVKIDYHADLVPTAFTTGGWFYLPATESGDDVEPLLNIDSYSIKVDPHSTASNQIRGSVNVSGGTGNIETEAAANLETEASVVLELDNKTVPYDVTGTYTPDSWNSIILTYATPNLKLYINGSLADTNSSVSGTLYDSNSDLIIGA